VSASAGTPSGYKSLGASGGDGSWVLGDSTKLVAWDTSFDYDLNDLGYCSQRRLSGQHR